MMQAEKIANNAYLVSSERDSETVYSVSLIGDGTCSCPHWMNRLAGTGASCKHLCAALQQRTSELEADRIEDAVLRALFA